MDRRTFLAGATAAGLGTATSTASGLLRSVGSPSPLGAISTEDRILVVIQLAGGNDGLSSVIPVDDDLYYKLRPTLAVEKQGALPLDGTPLLRLHPQMEGMQRMFNDGRLAIVENIGYDNASLSHFSGTEIWNTASGTQAGETLNSGWLGRLLKEKFPEFPLETTSYPPAIQMGSVTSSILTVDVASMGMALTDPTEFEELVAGGAIVAEEEHDDSPAGREWRYIRMIDAQSSLFAGVIRKAAGQAGNLAVYPSDNPLAASLSIIARLIAGGLPTPVYVATLPGFDTHAGQAILHPPLLRQLSDALAAFTDDLNLLNIADRVVVMTVSEFGRRAAENWSGTDHGGAAPHFVLGGGINGGRVYGGVPDLQNLDADGNLRHVIDFRCYYASVIAPLFGLDETTIKRIMPVNVCAAAERIPLYHQLSVSSAPLSVQIPALLQVAPNPASDQVWITLPAIIESVPSIILTASDGRSAGMSRVPVHQVNSSTLMLDISMISSGVYQMQVIDAAMIYYGSVVVHR
jgi:uncharacterized protein (DUF1501 family)